MHTRPQVLQMDLDCDYPTLMAPSYPDSFGNNQSAFTKTINNEHAIKRMNMKTKTHTTDWLPIPEYVEFQAAPLVYRLIQGSFVVLLLIQFVGPCC